MRAKLLSDTIQSRITIEKPLSILNIGSATGRTSEILQEFGEVTSVEYDKACCEFSKNILDMQVINASIIDLPFPDEKFDLVCAFDVIEHVADDESAISEMYRVCKASGHLFLTVPAFQSLWSVHDEVNHHYRRYRKNNLLRLFSGREGSIIKCTYFNSLLFIPIFLLRKTQAIRLSKKRKRKKSDFEVISSSFVNRLFYSIFNLERMLLKRWAFLFGVSLMLLWKKK